MENTKIEAMEDQLHAMELVNAHNEGTLRDIIRQLDKIRATKAWKIMLLFRKFKTEVLDGSMDDRKRFFGWIIRSRQVINRSKLLGLDQFDPFLPSYTIRTITEYKQSKVHTLNKTKILDESASCDSEIIPLYGETYAIGIDVLRFAVIEWDFRWQRPQQISVQFSSHGHRVFYVSIDTIALHDATLTYTDIKSSIQVRLLQKNVWGVKLCSYQDLNAYRSTIGNDIDLQYLTWSIEAIKEKFCIGMTVSIVDLPFWTPLVIGLGDSNCVVYDCMDDHSGFSTNSVDMLTSEETLENGSDLIVVSSQRLYNKIDHLKSKTLLIRNAGEYEHFEKVINEITLPYSKSQNDIIIGYYGAISEWFDSDLLYDLAVNNKKWKFILVGNTFGCDTSKLEKLNNVQFTGEIPYTDLPAYLHSFDICLIPFKVINLTLATNPVKVYEYMSAGKPVISTRLPEVELMSELVYLADDADGFEKAIKKALSENDETLIDNRKAFAKNNTWETRYDVLYQDLLKKLFPRVSVVVVSYGSWPMTHKCLESLLTKSAYPNLEIIVVDNGSDLTMRKGLASIQDPRLKIVLLPKNVGFASGNTEGCKASSGDYIILLNNDTIVPLNWVHKLIKGFNKDDKLGMLGPVSNSVGNDQMLDYCITDPFNGPDPMWIDEFYRLYRDRIRITDYLGFFCVAIRRSVYEEVGELDSNFGIGMFEDDDYCERVREAGYKIAIAEDCFVYHYGSASFKSMKGSHRDEIWTKNKQYFQKKWGKAWMQPKPPANLFHGSVDEDTIEFHFKSSNKRSYVIFGQENWVPVWEDWQTLSANLSDSHLVIVSLLKHMDNPIIGTRKLGPNLYLTNVIGMFRKCKFDIAVFCGQSYIDMNLEFKKLIIIKSCYSQDDLNSIINEFPSAVLFNDFEELGSSLDDLLNGVHDENK